eukprot:SAG31_NODE_29865_length_388_cov_1.958478_2_plen_102_part_01
MKFKTKQAEKAGVAQIYQEKVSAGERATPLPVPGGATTAETLDEAVKYIRHSLPDISAKKLVIAVRRQFPGLETSGVKVSRIRSNSSKPAALNILALMELSF